MNDAQLLERLATTDPCADAMPADAWTADRAWVEVERTVAPARSAATPWRGWSAAAAAFVVVLLIGTGVTLLSRTAADDPPVTNTTTPPVTSSVPPTTQPSAVPVSPEVEAVIGGFFAAYNDNEPNAATALFTPDATVDFDAATEPGPLPVAGAMADRIESGALFAEDLEPDTCVQLGGAISCEVVFEDVFTAHLDLEASRQTWQFRLDGDRIAALEVTAAAGPRVDAMREFDEWLRSRDLPGVLAGDGEWVRTEATAQLIRAELVEYGALASGVSADDWAVVSSFYERLSADDGQGAVALFAPDGTYDLAENDDVNAAPVLERGGPIADPEIRQQFIWWYDYMKVDWQPIRCVAGDAAGEIRCRSREVGVTTLPLPGGVAEGLVVFTIADEGIMSVIDHTLRGTQLRDWWRDWMELNQPQYVDVWLTPTGPGQGAAPLTTDFASVTLELYPPYLVERGVEVPPEYLDGSLLPDDWVPRPPP